MIRAIHDLLSEDSMLTGMLSGGTYNQYEYPEISRQVTPQAFDDYKELKPCALVTAETSTPFGPYQNTERLFVAIYFYQRFDYDVIQCARRRTYQILHNQHLLPKMFNDTSWRVFFSGDTLLTRDTALDCRLEVSRYWVVVNKEKGCC